MYGHTHSSRKKNSGRNQSRHLILKENDQEFYGRIIKALGNCIFEWENLNTGKIAITKTAGKLTRGPGKKMIRAEDIVLIQGDNLSSIKQNYYINLVYTPDEAKKLKQMGELENLNPPENAAQPAVMFESEIINTNEPEAEINIDDI